MSLKRLGELKDLLLGFDHEPNPVLRSLMKKESNIPHGTQLNLTKVSMKLSS